MATVARWMLVMWAAGGVVATQADTSFVGLPVRVDCIGNGDGAVADDDAGGVAAGDWNQWRGSQRDGVADAALPITLPEALRRVWRVDVGEGHSSPVVAGKLVFAHTRRGEAEVVRAVSLDDGQTIWRDSYPLAYRMNPAARAHGKGPKSTPIVADGRLYTLGITEVLSSIDAATGALLWRKDFEGQFRQTSPVYGTAMSPMLEAGALIAHIGAGGDGNLVAFNANTGAIRWSTGSDGPGYASPILVEIGGVRQLVTQTDAHIIGVGFEDGRPLWQIPFHTDFDQNIVTPLVYWGREPGDRPLLIFSGLDQGVFAVALEHQGDAWAPEEVWRNETVSLYMSSPVLVGSRVFGMSHRRSGQFFCLDARSGEVIWTSRGREAENAALVVAGERIVVLTDGAELIVLSVGADTYAPEARYSVADSPTWAHPVLTDQGVLIKDRSSLALWSF